MVFLRPVVVRDTQQSDSLSLDRYDLMRLRRSWPSPSPARWCR
jgi:general secretion pathway protein D